MKLAKQFKKVIYFAAYYSGIYLVFYRAAGLLRDSWPCIIVNYHRIVKEDDKFLSKGPVVHHPIKEFEKEIAFFKKCFQVISIDDAVDVIKSGSTFKRPCLVVTFDDGYRDNFTAAYPILRKNKVPAIVYLITSLIDSSERSWTDKLEYALISTKVRHFRMQRIFGDNIVKIWTRKQKELVNVRLAEQMKGRPDDERKRLLNHLLNEINIDVDNGKRMDRLMLNWSEVKLMSRNGITFGAHTHTHPILSQMPLQKAKDEIVISKNIIEGQLGVKVKHFAFPNGREKDFSESLRCFCVEIGFESVASVVYGMNDGRTSDNMNLKRIGARAPVWMLAGELFRLILEWYVKKK